MKNSQDPFGRLTAAPNKQKDIHATAMYIRFIVMAILMFAAMYFSMFAMVDKFENLIPNINNLHMTLLMTAIMLLIELAVMNIMYPKRELNLGIASLVLALAIFAWFGIREQINVDDKQFAKGMIPHHAAAVLMAEKASLTDPELIQLQRQILETQRREIALMKRKLKALEGE
ncbi:DUF305 domain-containing protein [Sphingobacterium sp.]|uniref:DUF305 domain-containing protein n=1 Tax=Sphingobacterium sp. TaxID=341027 RepID=UPI0031DAE099